MIELSQHIECLLLEHNCVIIPNLGGFVAQDCPAVYIEEENLFFPPYRDVAFNPLLQTNDGLLVQSYMNATGASYTDTQRTIEAAVAKLKRTMEEEHSVELHGIGVLRWAGNGQYEFEPVMGGIVAPNYFGLDTVIAKPMADTEISENSETAASETKTSGKYYTLRLHKGGLRTMTAAAIATLCYFLWPVAFNSSQENSLADASANAPKTTQRVTQKKMNTPQTATFIPVAEAMIPTELKDIVEEVVTEADLELALAAQQTEAKADTLQNVVEEKRQTAPHKKEEPVPKTTEEQGYVVVLASQVSAAGAEDLVHRLQKAGFKDATIRHDSKVRRVTFGTYPSNKDAHASLKSLRAQHPAFTDAWILKL